MRPRVDAKGEAVPLKSAARRLCLVLFAFLAVGRSEAGELKSLLEERELVRITNEIDVAVDRKEWDRARSFFADEVRVDFTSLVGGEPAQMKSDDLIGAWKTNLVPEKKTFHLRGNHIVSVKGDEATVYSHGYAWNQMAGVGSDLWEVWGNYTHALKRTPAGWRVVGFTFVKTHERGNALVRTSVGAKTGP